MASTTSESTADFPRGRRVRVRQDQSVGPAGTRIEVLEPAGHPSGGSHTASASESPSAANTRSGEALMTRTAVSVRLIAGAPVPLVDHARAERLGLDQVEPKVFGDRRQEGRAATDDDRIAEHAQLVDEAELDRCRGQAGAADRDVLVGRVERRSGLLGHRRLGEPGVALNAVERAAEDDLRDSAPDIGERGPELVVAHRRIRLPHQHGLVKPAAAEIAAERACLRDVETKLLLVRDRPPERARAVGDKAVHRDAHRVDQHGFKLIAPERRTMIAMKFTIELDIGLSFLPQAALPQLVTDRETKTHRRGRSKRSYGHCRRRTEIPEAERPPDTEDPPVEASGSSFASIPARP